MRAKLASGGSGSQSDGSSDGPQNPSAAKKFIWWGKPLWHDMGYVAVSQASLQVITER